MYDQLALYRITCIALDDRNRPRIVRERKMKFGTLTEVTSSDKSLGEAKLALVAHDGCRLWSGTLNPDTLPRKMEDDSELEFFALIGLDPSEFRKRLDAIFGMRTRSVIAIEPLLENQGTIRTS